MQVSLPELLAIGILAGMLVYGLSLPVIDRPVPRLVVHAVAGVPAGAWMLVNLGLPSVLALLALLALANALEWHQARSERRHGQAEARRMAEFEEAIAAGLVRLPH